MMIPIVTGKIALAHLNEFADYYVRLQGGGLQKMEAEAEADAGFFFRQGS